MTRLWLTEWEWACCGDPFRLGDEVDFGVESRTAHPALAEELGAELAATVDAMESHHVEEFTDRVRGRVVAISAVTREVIERRSLRPPGHGAPPNAAMPADGDEWPIVLANPAAARSWGTRPSRFVIEVVPVPGAAQLTPVHGVRLPVDDEDDESASTAERADPPPERRRRSLGGWLVDVDEDA